MIQIIGKGGFAREVAAYLSINGESIQHYENDMIGVQKNIPTIIAIGDPALRKSIAEKFNELEYVWIMEGNSYSNIGALEGCIICPGTIMTVNIKLGRHVIINLNCTVGHDCVIGSFVTISPGVNISGNVTIGNGCYIGTNAVIREKITICNNVVIGAGAVVVKDITEPGVYVGNPCKKK